MEEIDLIDDIWSQIFSYFGVDRARLANVCKRWAKVILHPKNWRVFEVDFTRRAQARVWSEPGRKQILVQADSIQPFIAKNCTNLIDCHITVKKGSSVFGLLNTLLQIKTLRRLALQIDTGSFGGALTPSLPGEKLVDPQCKGLVLLNLKQVIISPEELRHLLAGLPNLEELHLGQSLESLRSVDVFEPAKKLKWLTFGDGDVGDQLQAFSKLLPNLRWIVHPRNNRFGAFSAIEGGIEKEGNVLLVSTVIFTERHVDKLRQLSPLLSPASHPLLLLRALHEKDSIDTIRYLITELKYDVNLTSNIKYHSNLLVRITHEAYQRNFGRRSDSGFFVYSGEFESPYNWRKYPLHAALAPKSTVGFGEPREASPANNEIVELLLKHGANPNSILSNESPLSYCTESSTFLLLLKYGANPNKLVNGRPAFWSIFNPHFKTAPIEVLKEIVGTCDINAKYGELLNETALLKSLTSSQRAELAACLLNAGAMWTSEALNMSYAGLPSLFEEVVRDRKADLSMISAPVVFKSLEQGMLEIFRDHLKTLTADIEAPNLSPMHYAALLLVKGPSEESYKPLAKSSKGEKLRSDAVSRWKIKSESTFGTQEQVKPKRLVALHSTNEYSEFGTVPSTPSSSLSFGTTSSSSGFGTTPASSGFGTTSSSSGFGTAPSTSGFGSTPASSSSGLSTTPSGFGSTPSSGFGSAPASSGFGSTPSSSGFGTTSSSSGFGTTPASFGFGSTPASSSSGFGTTPASSGFGSTPSSSGFGTTSSSSGFGTTSASSGFGSRSLRWGSAVYQSKLDSIDEVIACLNCGINEKTTDGATPLLLLCKSVLNGAAKIKNAASLIKCGANVNLADVNGWTPLHAALYLGEWAIAALLIEHGANINAQDTNGITPFMALIYGFRHNRQMPFTDFESEWAKLIALDVDLTLVDQSFHRSLVHLMAAVGSPSMFECAKEKLLRPELINAKDIEGFTPLHYAVMFDNIDTVRYLLDNGADTNAQTTALKLTPAMTLCNMFGTTAITFYLKHYNTLLLGKATARQVISSTLLRRVLIEPPWFGPLTVENMETEIWSNFDMLKELVLHSNLHVTDDDGNTILQHLIMLIQPHSYVSEIFEIISEKSFKPLWHLKNFNNETAAFLFITYAIGGMAKHWDTIMKIFKDHEINPDQYSTDGKPAWEYVLEGSLSSDMKLDFMNISGMASAYPESRVQIIKTNPLFSALKNSTYHPSLIRAIIAAYPNAIKETNENGATPLISYVTQVLQHAQGFTANLSEDMSVIDVLLNAPGIDINAQDKNGNTALHIACKYFHTGVIDAIHAHLAIEQPAAVNCYVAFKLVEVGARTDLKNNRGQTPLDLAPMLKQQYEKAYPIVKLGHKMNHNSEKKVLWTNTNQPF